MENVIIFIIFIIFSALRSLAENRQKAGQRPGGRPGGLPMPPVLRPNPSQLRPRGLPPEYSEVVFDTVEAKKEGTAGVWLPSAQIAEELVVSRHAAVFNQVQLFQPQAATFLQGIVYAEVLGSPRAKKPWQYRK